MSGNSYSPGGNDDYQDPQQYMMYEAKQTRSRKMIDYETRGKRQVYRPVGDPKTWTRNDKLALAHMLQTVNELGRRDVAVGNPRYGIADGFIDAARGMLQAQQMGFGLTQRQFAAFEPYLIQDNEREEEMARARQMRIGMFDEPDDEDDDDMGPIAAAGALNGMRLADAPEYPAWLEFTAKRGRFLEPEEPKNARARAWLPAAGEGCCALRALFAAGIPFRDLRNLDKEEWKNVRVEQMTEFLRGRGQPHRFYDALGRIVVDYQGNGSAKMHFLLWQNHVAAFVAGAQEPFRLKEVERAQHTRKVYEYFGTVLGKWRGTNSIEVAEFFENCGIRAPVFGGGQFSFTVDMKQAYPTIMQSVDNIFPISTGVEKIEHFEAKLVAVGELGDEFVYVQCNYGTARFTADEIKFLPVRESTDYFWIWAPALKKLLAETETLYIRGRFELFDAKRGREIDLEDFARENDVDGLLEEMKLERGLGAEKAFKNAMVHYSGFLGAEKTVREVCTIPFELQPDEVAALRARERELCDFSTQFCEGKTKVTRGSIYRQTGRPALLAIYSYVSVELIMLWREIKAADKFAVLLLSRTDCIGFYTKMRRAALEQLPRIASGRFKIEKQNDEKEGKFRGVWSMSCEVKKNIMKITREEAHDARSVLIQGPPGAGKTHFVVNSLIPRLRQENPTTEIICATTTKEFAAVNGWELVQSLFRKTLCSDRCRQRVERSILICDEISLADPATLRIIQLCNAYRLYLIGDACQLSQVGDIERIAARMGCALLNFDYADINRFTDGGRMTTLLTYLRAMISRSGPNNMQAVRPPRSLRRRFEEYGVQIGPAAPGSTVLAWEHVYVNAYRADGFVAQTVHSAQGKTIEGTISVVDCWRDVRLLYTAISRARSLDQVVVVPDELALHVDRRVGGRQMEDD
jgi:hypothetical protein